MGGTSFCISIEPPAPSLIKRALNPRSTFMDKLLSRRPRSASLEDPVLDIPLPRFQRAILLSYRQFLAKSIPKPWEATTSFFKTYLHLIRDESMYVRGYRYDKELEWTVQLSFSGCGGMAGVSAIVAEHWAHFWYQRERENIEALIRSHGLNPDNRESPVRDETIRLFPVKQWGYASFWPEYAGFPPEELEEGQSSFELDQACHEGNKERADRVCRFLAERFDLLMKDRRCRCQFCDPHFDLSLLKGMPA